MLRTDAKERNDAAAKSLELSLELLEEHERARYTELGIFPEDTAVPAAVAVELWGVDPSEAEAALLRFDDLSLLKYSFADKTFRLHDVLYDWLRRRAAGPGAHGRLVDRWGDVYRLPPLYAWRRIGWHLKGAEHLTEMRRLLLDISWIGAKLEPAGLESLIADFELAQRSEPHRRLQRALTQSSHVIAEFPQQLPSQLYARLVAVKKPELAATMAQLCTQLQAEPGCILPLWPALTQADSELLRTLEGHAAGVRSVTLSGDGRILVSGSDENTIKVWDLGTGHVLRTLEGHAGGLSSVALSGDGRTLVSGSLDTTIKIWDLGTGRMLRTLEGHAGGVSSVALSADGRTLVFGSSDNTIKVWDLGTGRALRTQEGHARGVNSVALSADGRNLVSGSEDNTIKVWELGTGRTLRTLKGHARGVNSVALSGKGRTLVFGSDDNTIKVWELEKGRAACTLKGHAREVRSVALSGDGRTLVSGPGDNTIKVWELRTGRVLRTLEGHAKWVKSVALGGDGRTLVSSSYDKTIRVWDLGTGACRATFFAEAAVLCLALSATSPLAAGDASGRVHLFEIRP